MMMSTGERKQFIRTCKPANLNTPLRWWCWRCGWPSPRCFSQWLSRKDQHGLWHRRRPQRPERRSCLLYLERCDRGGCRFKFRKNRGRLRWGVPPRTATDLDWKCSWLKCNTPGILLYKIWWLWLPLLKCLRRLPVLVQLWKTPLLIIYTNLITWKKIYHSNQSLEKMSHSSCRFFQLQLSLHQSKHPPFLVPASSISLSQRCPIHAYFGFSSLSNSKTYLKMSVSSE